MKTYKISKRIEIAGAHRLSLPYVSKCTNLHGHNWIVTIYCKSNTLDSTTNMIVDFTLIKKSIQDALDHQFINDVVGDLNPTAEYMAEWIAKQVSKLCFTGYCYRVDVQESEGNIATYECDEDE